jgi:hypothetical protein
MGIPQKMLRAGAAIAIAGLTAATACAQTEHYYPASFNIRDFALPEHGFYGAIYNFGYSTSNLKDASGNQISSITIQGPGGNVSTTINLKVDVNLYALAPVLIWVPKKKILGAKYGVMLNPTFANASLDGLLARAEGTGVNVSTGQFNIGDTYVVPAWLDWGGKHYDFAINYGFYIPTGKYNIQTVSVPVVGDVRVASANNVGLGFWENQTQQALYLYPWADRRMAIENALTWEFNQPKRGFDLAQGQHLTWNWGISQYLPLKKDQSILAEIGPAGYANYQIADDTGTAARNPSVHDQVYGVGVQVGVTVPKRMMVMNFHWFHEYSAVDRFQGTALGLSFVARFGNPK